MKRLLVCLLTALAMFACCCYMEMSFSQTRQMYSYVSIDDEDFQIDCKIPKGSVGVWIIPEINTITPLYERRGTDGQAVIDAEWSALIMPLGVGRLIGDHADSITNNGLGRWNMNQVHVDGDAFLVKHEQTEMYTCYMILRARSTGYGYIVDGMGVYPHRATDILCASCANDDGTEVYIAFYRYTGVFH